MPTKTSTKTKLLRDREVEKKRALKENERTKKILKMQREVEKERMRKEREDIRLYTRLSNHANKTFEIYQKVSSEAYLAKASNTYTRTLHSRLIKSHSNAIYAYKQFVHRFPSGATFHS